MFLYSSNEAIIRKSINMMHKIIRIAGTIRVLFEGRVLLEEIQYLCEKYLNIKSNFTKIILHIQFYISNTTNTICQTFYDEEPKIIWRIQIRSIKNLLISDCGNL